MDSRARGNRIKRYLAAALLMLLASANVSAGLGIAKVLEWFSTIFLKMVGWILKMVVGDLNFINALIVPLLMYEPITKPQVDGGYYLQMAGIVMEVLMPLLVFMILYTAIKMMFVSHSPGERAAAKTQLQNLLIALIIIPVSPLLYQILINISYQITVVMLGSMLQSLSARSFGDTISGAYATVPSEKFVLVFCCAQIMSILALIIIFIRHIAVIIFAVLMPLTVLLYMFGFTKSVGRKFLKYSITWALVPMVMAVWIIVATMVLSTTGSAGDLEVNTATLMVIAFMTMMVLSPLQIAGALALFGAMMAGAGQMTSGWMGVGLVAAGQMMQAKSPEAIVAAGMKAGAGAGMKGLGKGAKGLRSAASKFGKAADGAAKTTGAAGKTAAKGSRIAGALGKTQVGKGLAQVGRGIGALARGKGRLAGSSFKKAGGHFKSAGVGAASKTWGKTKGAASNIAKSKGLRGNIGRNLGTIKKQGAGKGLKKSWKQLTEGKGPGKLKAGDVLAGAGAAASMTGQNMMNLLSENEGAGAGGAAKDVAQGAASKKTGKDKKGDKTKAGDSKAGEAPPGGGEGPGAKKPEAGEGKEPSKLSQRMRGVEDTAISFAKMGATVAGLSVLAGGLAGGLGGMATLGIVGAGAYVGLKGTGVGRAMGGKASSMFGKFAGTGLGRGFFTGIAAEGVKASRESFGGMKAAGKAAATGFVVGKTLGVGMSVAGWGAKKLLYDMPVFAAEAMMTGGLSVAPRLGKGAIRLGRKAYGGVNAIKSKGSAGVTDADRKGGKAASVKDVAGKGVADNLRKKKFGKVKSVEDLAKTDRGNVARALWADPNERGKITNMAMDMAKEKGGWENIGTEARRGLINEAAKARAGEIQGKAAASLGVPAVAGTAAAGAAAASTEEKDTDGRGSKTEGEADRKDAEDKVDETRDAEKTDAKADEGELEPTSEKTGEKEEGEEAGEDRDKIAAAEKERSLMELKQELTYGGRRSREKGSGEQLEEMLEDRDESQHYKRR